MIGTPDGLVVQADRFEIIGNNLAKPVYGTLNKMYVEFREELVYSGADSEKSDEEIRRPVEVCLIQTDKFSRVPLRVRNKERGIKSELSPKQEIELAPLYEHFKSQKDSTDTRVGSWEACSDMERSQLNMLGIWSVEQLANFEDAELYRLGPGGKDLRDRALRHVKTKTRNGASDRIEQLQALLKEKEEHAKALAAQQERIFELEAQLAVKRSKKSKESQDEVA